MLDILFSNFVVLFIVIDPLGMVPIFIALTQGASAAEQRRAALRGTAMAAVILVVFYFIGDVLLRLLGIGLPAFRVAGGILLFLLAIDMIFARQSGLRSTTARERHEAAHRQDVSIFPLAFPLIAGPGAMTTVLLMASGQGNMGIFLGTFGLLVFVLALTTAALFTAPALMRLLGETGANVISRLLGLVLASLAAQYVLDGIKTSLLS